MKCELSVDTCEFMNERIDVLGFVIDENGLHDARSRVKAIYEAPQRNDSKQVTLILGIINIYARILQNRSEKLRPLLECVESEKFTCTKERGKALCWVRNEYHRKCLGHTPRTYN